MLRCTTATAASRLLLLSVLQALVALLFLKGFLLTRVELPDIAQGGGSSSISISSARQPPPYQKAVVLIVDAVRYDFLCGKQHDLSGSLMPKTLRLVKAGVSLLLARQAKAHATAADPRIILCAGPRSSRVPVCRRHTHDHNEQAQGAADGEAGAPGVRRYSSYCQQGS